MSPRELAYEVLLRWTEQGGPATLHLEALLAPANGPALAGRSGTPPALNLSPSERGLAMELVHGIIRRRGTLDALLASHCQRPLEKIEAGAKVLLYLGLYQLVFLSGAPPYAVVNETAQFAKRLRKPQWTGFVNGILRSAGRSLTDQSASVPGPCAVPLTGEGYRIMATRSFPDPTLDFAGYFAAAFSLPHWLVERWRRRFSNPELTRLGFWFNAPPHLCLRVNTLRTNREAFLAALPGAGVAGHPGQHPDAVHLEGSARVGGLPGFHEGWFTVQDESAMWAASLLAPRPGERVLDLCAAPGGKATHLATLMQNEGTVIATDVDEKRLALVSDTCARLGLSIVEPLVVRRDSTDLPDGPFDAILMDVPCSNTGVLGKRPEVRWRLTPADLVELVALQRQLMQEALSRLRPGGRLVYATCSIEPEENQQLIAGLLSQRPELQLVKERHHLPGQPGDGGYQALLSLS
ncbi:MAG: transcription antitermination factor NusB [Planctomycetales bacterium]